MHNLSITTSERQIEVPLESYTLLGEPENTTRLSLQACSDRPSTVDSPKLPLSTAKLRLASISQRRGCAQDRAIVREPMQRLAPVLGLAVHEVGNHHLPSGSQSTTPRHGIAPSHNRFLDSDAFLWARSQYSLCRVHQADVLSISSPWLSASFHDGEKGGSRRCPFLHRP